jgi:hypothetical protein
MYKGKISTGLKIIEHNSMLMEIILQVFVAFVLGGG